MNARDRVLAAVRDALGPREVDAERVRREAAELLADPASTRPVLPAGSLADAFAARVTTPKVAATVDRIDATAQLPAAVRRHLERRGLPPTIALQPAADLTTLDWVGFVRHEQVAPDETVVVGVARWGIAETGSLVFHSGPDTPILANFLPLHHVVLLHERDIVGHLEDYAALAATCPVPRNAILITGASGTTDIEGSLVLGAHGPRHLHVVIARD